MVGKWDKENTERVRETNRQWRIKNAEHIKKYRKEYNKKHREERRKYNFKWRRTNVPAYVAIKDRAYFGENKGKALLRDNYSCRMCGMTEREHLLKHGRRISMHHIDRVGRGKKNPNNDLNNLMTMCIPCHLRLHNTKHKDKILGGGK